MEDQELIGRVLAGDPSAERALYDAHVDRVFRLVYRMAGDLDRAQDYTQETFIRAFAHLGEFRGEAALSTWLGSIAISIALNGLRKVRRLRDRELSLDDAAPTGRVVTEAEPDLKIRIAQAINDLPDGYRAVFVMHDVEGATPTRRSPPRSACIRERRKPNCFGLVPGSEKHWLTSQRTD